MSASSCFRTRTRYLKPWLAAGGLLAAAASVVLVPSAWPLDQVTDDLSASVDVTPVFQLAISNPNLSFSQVSPGGEDTLGEGQYFNEVRCRSNSGRSWYLKAQLVELKHVDRGYALEPAQLAWNVVETTGESEPQGGRGAFQPFASEPKLLYNSQGKDQRGKEVILRFQYRLSCPANAPAGQYVGQIIFTMAESP